MSPRFFIGAEIEQPGGARGADALDDQDGALAEGSLVALAEGPSRHAQVLRLQPGDELCVFDGTGGEWHAMVTEMGRRVTTVRVDRFEQVSRELPLNVTLAVGMPANDRMDALIEKATELGAFAIQPLMCERSVLRLDGDRAAKKVRHWQGVAIAASEQSGRTLVPRIHAVASLATWLEQGVGRAGAGGAAFKAVLSLRDSGDARTWVDALPAPALAGILSSSLLAGSSSGLSRDVSPGFGRGLQGASCWFLSGPEGGLTEAEEASARSLGWAPISLGPRVLRADTAPLALLSLLAGRWG